MLDTVVKAAVTMIAPEESPTPRMAESSGIPAASSDPNVTKRTTPAKSTPTASVQVSPNDTSWNTEPPNTTRMPAASAGAASACRSSRVCGVTSVLGPSNCTCVYAMVRSSEIALVAYSEYGSTTAATWAWSPIVVAMSWMACFTAGSSTVEPCGAW